MTLPLLFLCNTSCQVSEMFGIQVICTFDILAFALECNPTLEVKKFRWHLLSLPEFVL